MAKNSSFCKTDFVKANHNQPFGIVSLSLSTKSWAMTKAVDIFAMNFSSAIFGPSGPSYELSNSWFRDFWNIKYHNETIVVY